MANPVWSGIEIDPTLLRERGYLDPLTVGGVQLPRVLGYMQAGINEAGTAVENAGARLVTVSTSSASIGTGGKTFAVQSGRGFAAGMLVIAYATDVPDNYMAGRITSYDPGSGALVIDALDTGGSGTYTAWTIALSGRGKQGIQGPQGPVGAGTSINAAADGTPVNAEPRGLLNAIHSLSATDNPSGDSVDIALDGDVASPGANMGYGTNGAGVKGWRDVAGRGANSFTGAQNLQDNELLRATMRDYALTKAAKGNVSGAQTIDLTAANYVTATAVGATVWTFSNPPASTAAGGLILTLTNGGAFTQTWPASVRWPGGTAPSLTAAGVDVLVFITDDAGSTWRGVQSMRDSK